MIFRIQLFLFLIVFQYSLPAQVVKIYYYSPGGTRNDNSYTNNDYIFNVGIEDYKINCVETVGVPSDRTGPVYGYRFDMGSYTIIGRTIKMSLEAWEDDGCDNKCDFDSDCWDEDDRHCVNSDIAFRFSDYKPIEEQLATIDFCNADYKVRFKFSWIPPLLQFKTLDKSDYCGNKDIIKLECDKTIFEGKYYWEYNDGSGWKALSLTTEPTYSFLATQYTQLTKLKFRVSPYINSTICQSTELLASISIYPPPPTNVDVKVNNILCKDANNGSVEVGAVTGFYDTYHLAIRKEGDKETYNIPNHPKSGTTNTFTNLSPGNYFLRVLNNIYQNDTLKQICSLELPITISQPAEKIAFNSTPSTSSNYNGFNVSCNKSTDGSLQISGTGGTGSYSYSLDNVNYQPNATFTGLKAGNYNLYLRDQNGCMPAAPISVA